MSEPVSPPQSMSAQQATEQRRDFLKQLLVGASVAGGLTSSRNLFAEDSPNEKLNVALIGCGNRARSNISGVSHQNIVAMCDVDSRYMGAQKEKFTAARTYSDMRKLYDKEEKNIDAVVVSTPDHTHFPATVRGLVRGKHVYCEKPLTHTVEESRLAASLAKKHGVKTQMGTQIHSGDNYRRVVELVQSGAIGKVSEVHIWCGKGWSDGRIKTGDTAPDYLDWDLWLGPAADREYLSGVHPANWRRFWEFGAGTLGDMGCHIMDLAFWALDLDAPTSVKASGPEVHPVGTPFGLAVEYQFPARGDRGPIKYTWHDGNQKPPVIAEIKKNGGPDLSGWGIGAIFVGEKGMLAADYGRRLLLPEANFKGFEAPAQTIPKSVGHYQEWINACRGEGESLCHFGYSGPLTQTVLLGTLAYRTGKTIQWDNEAGKDTANPEVNELLTKTYRKGWENPI